MLKQSSILFVAKVVGFGIRIILPVFLVRILTKADIGVYNQFFLVEVLIQTIFQLGINQSQYFFIPRDRKNAGGYFLNCVLLNLVIFTAAYVMIGIFRHDLATGLGMPVLELFYWYLAPYSILMLLNVSVQIFMTARKKFKQAAIFDIVRQALASIATLIVAYRTHSLPMIIAALIVSRFVSLLLGVAYVHFRERGFQSERYFFGIWQQVRYGVMLGAAGTLGTVLVRMNEIAVSKFYGIETYAVYAQGMKQIPILMFFTQSIAAVALVRFAQLEKEGDLEGIRKFWDEVLGNTYAVGIPVTIAFVLAAKPLVTLMYTSAYVAAVPIFQLNAIAMLHHLINPTLVLRAMNRNDVSLKTNMVLVVLLPIALFAGMKMFGLLGIIGVHALMLIGNRLIQHTILNRVIPVHLSYIPPRESIWAFYQKSYRKGIYLLKETRAKVG